MKFYVGISFIFLPLDLDFGSLSSLFFHHEKGSTKRLSQKLLLNETQIHRTVMTWILDLNPPISISEVLRWLLQHYTSENGSNKLLVIIIFWSKQKLPVLIHWVTNSKVPCLDIKGERPQHNSRTKDDTTLIDNFTDNTTHRVVLSDA